MGAIISLSQLFPCMCMLQCTVRAQVHELTNALTLARSDLASAESEVSRLKELHSQVKAALQESYSTQQEQRKQVCWVWQRGGGDSDSMGARG